MLSDADLVERSRRRDAEAFGSLVERHHKLVFGVAFGKCRDATLAEDIAQDAFVVAWRDLDKLRDAGRVGSWVAGIARNLAASAARERARSAELPELAYGRTPQDDVIDREDRELLQRALDDIPDAHREALVLYYLEGQSVARIAEGLNIQEQLVKQRLSRGRNALRDNIATRVESALGRMRLRVGFGAGVVAVIVAAENAKASAATSAAGKGITIMSAKTAGLAALAALAIAGGVTVVSSRTSGEPANRATAGKRGQASGVSTPTSADTSSGVGLEPLGSSSASVAPSAEDDVMRALAGKEPRRKVAPIPVLKPPGNYELHTVDGFSIVHLGPGAPTTKPFGGPSDKRTRMITGRVVDRTGKPVTNAIVLADRGLGINARNDMMTVGGAVTDGAGAFSVAVSDENYALAVVREDWSEILRVHDQPIELRILGHGALSARFTYDGDPETFTVQVAMKGTPFSGRWETENTGRLAVPSLPPGRYTVSVGLAQSLFGGVSRTLSSEVTIVDGKTTELELALAAGTSVVLTAKPPAGSTFKGLTYWLFTGSAPRDGADANTRKKAENAMSLTNGGGAKNKPAEFHDVAPGTYHACAGFFDVATMGAFERPFGCTKLKLDASDSVREAEIVLAK